MVRTRVSELQKAQDQGERYSDIDISFTTDALTGRLKKVVNAEAIKQGVKNRIKTLFFERFYNSTYGSNLLKSLFEQNDSFLAESVQKTISNSLQNDPRISLLEVLIDNQSDENSITVLVSVLILTSNEVITVPMIVERIR